MYMLSLTFVEITELALPDQPKTVGFTRPSKDSWLYPTKQSWLYETIFISNSPKKGWLVMEVVRCIYVAIGRIPIWAYHG